MSDALPDQPQVTNYEVNESLKVAHQLSWTKAVENGGAVRLPPITEMEMLQVLEAAFNARGKRFNGELRREAQSLHRAAELARIRTQKYREQEALVRWAQDMERRLTGLVESIKDSRALRISDEFRALEALLPGVEPYTKADAAWESRD